ncbi:hypothetical protein [Actinomadura parmotrematis]|uniref:hypothetical protein n=1 Tax=Actinomadura parmotrematis TaxID=2864039 RepID=UPI00215D78E5|nr:hypothetical protein [Actinomadura parmotrematis]
MDESPELLTQLLKVVVGYTWFFETCDDEVLEDDTALEQMENAAHLLGRLTETDKQRLIAALEELAATETNEQEREFIQSFASAMGLTETEDD